MAGIITFLIGVFCGSIATIIIMSLCLISKEEDRKNGNTSYND